MLSVLRGDRRGNEEEERMKAYKNVDENWGDAVEVTVDDYRKQAVIFGADVDIEERADGIYIDGEMVAEAVNS